MNNISSLVNNAAETVDMSIAFNEVRKMHKDGIHPGFSTGFSALDKLYRIPPFGQLNVITGSPGSGKSELIDSIAINAALIHNWKVFIYSPENNPMSYHLQKMVEKLSGKPFFNDTNSESYYANKPQVTEEDIAKAEKLMRSNFSFVNCQIKGASVEAIINSIILKAITDKVNMVIIDPWNKVEHATQAAEKETLYIGRCLSKLQIIARERNIQIYIVAHPTKPRTKKDGSFCAATLYDINGSANWYNMTDNGFVVHRSWDDKTGTENLSKVRIAKIKDRRYGKCGEIQLKFQPWCGRFVNAG